MADERAEHIAENDNDPLDPEGYEIVEEEIELESFAKAAQMTNSEFFEYLGAPLHDSYPPDTAGYFIDMGEKGGVWLEAETFEKHYEKVPETRH